MALLRTVNRLPARSPEETHEVTYNGACTVKTARVGSRIHAAMLDRDGNLLGKLRLTPGEARALALNLMLAADQAEIEAAACLSVEVH